MRSLVKLVTVRRYLFAGVLLLSPSLIGCGGAEPLVVLGEPPVAGASSVLVALEQGDRRALLGEPAEPTALRIELPAEFSGDEETLLTRLQFAEPLVELGITRRGLVSPASEPSDPLSGRTSLSTELALLTPGADEVSLAPGIADAWVLDFPLPRPGGCLTGVPGEIAVARVSPRDLISVSSDLAIGVGSNAIFSFDAAGNLRTFPWPDPDEPQRLGLGANNRIWMATDQRVFIFDEATGVSSAPVLLPPDIDVVGVAEDPFLEELYVLTATGALYRKAVGAPSFTLLYQAPSDRIRTEGLRDQAARFYFSGPRQLLIAVDDLSALIDIDGDAIRLRYGDNVGTGFAASIKLSDGRLILAESARGDLFEYVNGRLEVIGSVPTLLAGMVPLDEVGERFLYIGTSGVVGTRDLRNPNECPEITASIVRGPDGLVKVGQRLLARGQLSSLDYGFAWIDPEF